MGRLFEPLSQGLQIRNSHLEFGTQGEQHTNTSIK